MMEKAQLWETLQEMHERFPKRYSTPEMRTIWGLVATLTPEQYMQAVARVYETCDGYLPTIRRWRDCIDFVRPRSLPSCLPGAMSTRADPVAALREQADRGNTFAQQRLEKLLEQRERESDEVAF